MKFVIFNRDKNQEREVRRYQQESKTIVTTDHSQANSHVIYKDQFGQEMNLSGIAVEELYIGYVFYIEGEPWELTALEKTSQIRY